ncbi:MAG: VOC family protein [Marinibacterium sp.]|nr:VOC family protein [Marinibacterium sp.]
MRLEHVNLTVADPAATAAVLQEIFGWQIRWQGAAKDNGFTVHVGDAESYLALYAPAGDQREVGDSYHLTGGLNHLGVVVEDLADAEARVRAAGFTPHSHADYEPGRRFYFDGPDGVEYEVVSYA